MKRERDRVRFECTIWGEMWRRKELERNMKDVVRVEKLERIERENVGGVEGG